MKLLMLLDLLVLDRLLMDLEQDLNMGLEAMGLSLLLTFLLLLAHQDLLAATCSGLRSSPPLW